MCFISRARYRAGQLRRSLRARVTPDDLEAARGVLGERLYPLFASMQAADQRHCLDVYRTLLANGCDDAEMLQAALLHDAGKGSIAGARFGIAHRVAYVLLEHRPALLNAAARWNGGMRALKVHDARTLELAREYGTSGGVVRLLADMERGENERARRLKAADDAS